MRCQILAVVGVLSFGAVHADTINVKPEPGALADALAGASAGDVLMLAPGRYAESVTVPGRITIDGGDADAVTIVAQDYAALNLKGDGIIIRNVTIEGGEATTRGISGDRSMRVEQCRFNALDEAVALMAAPLSDVVCCEFNDCGIAVRAIGDASPTVWGCRMKGGRIGVFAMGGAPYIVNNLFQDVENGVVLIADGPHTRVFRHNVFLNCIAAGIDLRSGDMTFPTASIRNSAFIKCGSPVIGDQALLQGVSHCAVEACENDTLDPAERHLHTDAIGLTVDADGTVRIEAIASLKGKGLPHAADAEGTQVNIGFTGGLVRPGVKPNAEASPPATRFLKQPYIANSVSEEHLYLQMHGLQMTSQSMVIRDGGRFDVFSAVDPNGQSTKIEFNISRYFGEYAFSQ